MTMAARIRRLAMATSSHRAILTSQRAARFTAEVLKALAGLIGRRGRR